jgi:fused signal recognition particle receptor
MAFGFKKRPEVRDQPGALASDPPPDETRPLKRGLFSRLKRGLSKTNRVLNEDIGTLLRGKIDDALLEELETRLLMADVGVEATREIIDELQGRIKRRQMSDAVELMAALQAQMIEILEPVSQPLVVVSGQHRPFVILVVGVNGAGKTTTIGKLAKRLQGEGHSVMLAAGDTFRAAAVEQLQTWGERNGVPVVAQGSGADSASVIFDAAQSVQTRGIDVLIADTAGRLHTQSNLMEELKKVQRVMRKLDPSAPHETLLVVDAGTGQNALNQAQQFHRAVGLTGLAITKLDGTAKGGILFAVAKRLAIPIRYIGIGESIEDLRPFDAREFVEALLSRDTP